MDAAQNSPRQPFSIKLWPPSQNTRAMLVERMTNNLSNPTVFTRKYGSLSKEEAAKNAKYIEEKAFKSANEHYDKEPDGDGSSAVQLYAKECSKLILEVLKRGPNVEEKGVVVLGSNGEEKDVAVSKPNMEEKDVVVLGSNGEEKDVVVLGSNGEEKDGAVSKPNLEEKDVVVSGPQETIFDISKGQRAFIEADEAQELLQPLKEPGNSYAKICFSNRSFGFSAARVAEPVLKSIKDQLKEVDLSDFVAGRPEAEALDVMNIFAAALEGSILKSLNLSDNALGEKGVRAFGKLLQSQTSLEELFLMNDGISEEAAKAVAELVPSTDKLRVLHFHNNMTGDEGALAIAEVVKRAPLLEDFRCSSTRVGSEGGIALSEAIGMFSNLRKLDLRDNMFGIEVGVCLSQALTRHQNLSELYLSYLNLEDEGAIAIANSLKGSTPSLEILEMAGNDITSKAAPALAACIGVMSSLTKLNLSENELKDDGAIQISNVLEDGHDQLKEVDLSVNSLRRSGARTLAQSVVNKAEFKLLSLNGNYISDEGIDELNEIFKKSPELLGPLDENDPDGEDGDDEDNEESGDEDHDELESKLKNLDVNQED